MTRTSDNMIAQLREGNHGRFNSPIHSTGSRGHQRPAHHHFGTIHVIQPRLLGDVGFDVGARDNSHNLRYLLLPDHTVEGEAQ